MSAAPLPGPGGRGDGWHRRFPGFDTAAQARHWDPVTAGVVLDRLRIPPELSFFTPAEQATAVALCDQLLGQGDGPGEGPRIPVVALIDARLAQGQTDGWRYAGMPEDAQAWRDTLGYLDADARSEHGRGFAACSADGQRSVIQAVQEAGSDDWHGLNAARVWSLWTRYACTAFYSHPHAWDEIGFSGPAYPRGYKNAGVDAREPFEVADHAPGDDPVAEGA